MVTNLSSGSIVQTLTLTLAMIIPSIALAFSPMDCTNKDLEVSCLAKQCAVTDPHTPVSVAIGPQIELCAYSGCTTYEYKHVKSDAFDIYHAEAPVGRKKTTDTSDPFALIVDRSDQVGLLKFGALVIPLICSHY